jgi:hypothetical protein
MNIEVGGQANVMFSIYNIGKTTLYNANVTLQADSVSGGEAFLGNIAPGATGNVDLYVNGQAATMDDGTVKILLTFEDESGEVTTIEEKMSLFVNEPYYEDPMMYEDMMGGEIMMGEEPQKKFPVWAIAAIAGGVLVMGAAALIGRKVVKKKKAAKAEAALLEEDLLQDDEDDLV